MNCFESVDIMMIDLCEIGLIYYFVFLCVFEN